MDTWLPLITLVVGFFVRGEYSRWSERGQLPERIERQLAIYDKLPDSDGRAELREHIELQVRYLVAFEVPATVKERLDQRWGLAYVFVGFLPLAVGLVEGWPPTWLAWASLGGAVVSSGGMMVTNQAAKSRADRRWTRLAAVEQHHSKAAPGAGSPGGDLAS